MKSETKRNMIIRVVPSLTTFKKEDLYTKIEDSRNPLLSYNHYLVITEKIKEDGFPPIESDSSYLELIYYNYGSSDTFLRVKNYWICGLLDNLLNVIKNKKVDFDVLK